MIAKILGIADLAASLFFLLSLFGSWFPHSLVLAAGIYLFAKGLFFAATLDFASTIDVIASVVIIFSLYISMPLLLSIITLIYIVQKGVFSLFSS